VERGNRAILFTGEFLPRRRAAAQEEVRRGGGVSTSLALPAIIISVPTDTPGAGQTSVVENPEIHSSLSTAIRNSRRTPNLASRIRANCDFLCGSSDPSLNNESRHCTGEVDRELGVATCWLYGTLSLPVRVSDLIAQ